MFGLGWTELFVVAIIAILVVPPKDLPGLMRNVGRWMGKARRVMRDFQREIEDAARVDELPQIRREVEQIGRQTNADFMRDLQGAPRAMHRNETPAQAALPAAAPEPPTTMLDPEPETPVSVSEEQPPAPAATEAEPAAAKS